MTGKLKILSTIVLTLSFITPNVAARELTDSITPDDTADIDNRPLLKRWFKDFPIVYSDTAYTTPKYVIVFKATLMNHSWGEHPGVKMKRQRIYAIPDSTEPDCNNDNHPHFITFTSLQKTPKHYKM